jgi:DNA-binding transcriptional regulator/RsmH inhibitor MraZ
MDMTDMMPGQMILKTDARGRVRVPVERREALLDEYEKSGLSAKKFALLVGMKHQTFATWATKRRKQRGVMCTQGSQIQRPVEAVPKLQWVEAVIEKDGGTTGQRRDALSVHLPGGARLEIGDSRQVALAAELLRALAAQRELPC